MEETKANRLASEWTNEIGEFPAVTKRLRETLTQLLGTFLDNDAEYAAEKLIKSFSEPIYYLNSIYHAQGVERVGSDYRGGLVNPAQMEPWRRELDDIREKLLRDVARQHKHFSIFLAAVS